MSTTSPDRPRVHFRTLGPLILMRDGQLISGFTQQRTRCALLLYVAEARRVRREVLTSMFWPDRETERAKRLLSQMLYELKKTLGDGLFELIGDEIVATEQLDTDGRQFERHAARGELDAACRLYHTEFLTDFSAPESSAFQSWVDRRRATLTRTHRKVRRSLIDQHTNLGHNETALSIAREWADIDPFEDEAQHRTVELLFVCGFRSEALQHFEQYAERIRKELDVAPLEETVQLVETIRQTPTSPAALAPRPMERRSIDPVAVPATTSHKSYRRHYLVALTFGIVGLALILMTIGSRDDQPSAIDFDAALAELAPTRIAVLYFEDQSEGEKLGHVAKGLTEALIYQLEQVDALSIVSRNGVRPYINHPAPLDSIVRALQVGSLVEGAIQASADSIRVSVHLVDARTRRRLGGTVLLRENSEIFALQDEIAAEVSRFLRQRLGREIRLHHNPRATTSVEAWTLYQQADETRSGLRATRTVSDPLQSNMVQQELRAADRKLELAERLDPAWGEPSALRGWIGLDMAALLGYEDTAAYNRQIRAALVHANKAIARKGAQPAALELRGVLRRQLAWTNPRSPDSDRWLAEAEADLRSSVELEPRRASAWAALSRLVQYQGRLPEAVLFARRALSEDAFLEEASAIHHRLFKIHWDTGDPYTAKTWCDAGLKHFPADARFVECQLSIPAWYPDGTLTLDSAATLLHKLATLDPAVKRGSTSSYVQVFRQALWAALLAHNDRSAEARAIIDSLRTVVAGHPGLETNFGFDEAHVLLVLEDTAGATAALARYVALNPQFRQFVDAFPPFAALRVAPAGAAPPAHATAVR